MTLSTTQASRLDATLGAGIDSQVDSAVSGAFSASLSAGTSGSESSANAGIGAGTSGVVDTAATGALSAALKVALRARLAKELGTARVTGSSGPSVGGSVSLGTSLGVGGALSASLGASASAGLSVSLITGLTAAVGAEIDRNLALSGLPPSERATLSATLKAALSDEIRVAAGSALSPPPAYPAAGGEVILDAEVTMQVTGAWHATLSLDMATAPPEGPFMFTIGLVEFRGTILPGDTGQYGGRARVSVVGGAGGLSKQLKARNYSGGVTRVRDVVADILRESGESLSSQSDADILGKQLASWQRTEDTAENCLQRLLDNVGANWRILRDGTLWVGVDTWPEVTPDGEVLDEDWGDGVVTVAPNDPTGVPGITLLGQRVSTVTHRVADRKLRTEFRANSLRSMLDGYLGHLRTDIDYAAKWRCRVVAQNADRTLQLMPDEPRMRGQGLDKVKIRVGIPGIKINAQPGATCNLGFENRDPSKPYATDWEEDSPLVSWDLTGALGAIAGVGSLVDVYLPYTPLPTPGGPIPLKVQGIISTGNAKARV
jgi:hypothetical protein